MKQGLLLSISMAQKFPALVNQGRDFFDVTVVPDDHYRTALEQARALGLPVTEYTLQEKE